MRSKLSWWSCVALFAVFYGLVGMTATMAEAFESLFGRTQDFSILQTASGWIFAAAMTMLALTLIVGLIGSAFSRGRVADVCRDLIRLHGFALWGALVPYACGSRHPWIYAPMSLGIIALLLAVDRRENAGERPWQTWALAALAFLTAAPVLLISRL